MLKINLSEWFEHDGLYEAYPDLRYVQVAQMPEISDKSYCSPDGETIIINPDKCVTDADKLNAVLEEIQNSIQIKEGFEEGASFEGTESYINSQKDNEEYEKYKSILGEENVPKTLEEFQEMKYNDKEKWKLFEDYEKSRSNNMISAFTSFDDYKTYKKKIETEIIGLTTVDGVDIKSQSKHFVERVFGTTEDPKTKTPRSGVKIEDIKEALLNGTTRHRKDSLRYFGNNCIVSVNIDSGNLIQTNPR